MPIRPKLGDNSGLILNQRATCFGQRRNKRIIHCIYHNNRILRRTRRCIIERLGRGNFLCRSIQISRFIDYHHDISCPNGQRWGATGIRAFDVVLAAGHDNHIADL